MENGLQSQGYYQFFLVIPGDANLSRIIVISRGHLPTMQWEEQMTEANWTAGASHSLQSQNMPLPGQRLTVSCVHILSCNCCHSLETGAEALPGAQDTSFTMCAPIPATRPPPSCKLGDFVCKTLVWLGYNFAVSTYILSHLKPKPLKGSLSILLSTYSPCSARTQNTQTNE